MTVRVYSSSDTSAPVLRGNTPGDLINLLEKCLVTGYGGNTPAGWTKPFSGTNVAAFKQGVGSNGMYLRVDDTSTVTTNRAARVTGFETMTGVNAGAPSPFPTEVQMPGGFHWFTHSSGVVANPRIWRIIADEMFFWIFISTRPTDPESSANYQESYAFGDIVPYKPGDATSVMLLGYSRGSANTSDPYPFQTNAIGTRMSSSYISIAVARSYTNLGGSVMCGWHADSNKGSTQWGAGYLGFPHGPDGGMYLSPVWLHEESSTPYSVRGIVPGVWVPCHYNIFSQSQVVEGQGELAGKTFLVRQHSACTAMFEISDTWER